MLCRKMDYRKKEQRRKRRSNNSVLFLILARSVSSTHINPISKTPYKRYLPIRGFTTILSEKKK